MPLLGGSGCDLQPDCLECNLPDCYQGRPAALKAYERNVKIHELAKTNWPTEVAEMVGVSVSTVHVVLRRRAPIR